RTLRPGFNRGLLPRRQSFPPRKRGSTSPAVICLRMTAERDATPAAFPASRSFRDPPAPGRKEFRMGWGGVDKTERRDVARRPIRAGSREERREGWLEGWRADCALTAKAQTRRRLAPRRAGRSRR